MASGDLFCAFYPADNEPPSANYMTLGLRNGHPYLAADAGADESAVFTGFLPSGYAGGGLSVVLIWMAASATSGNVVWNAQIERLEDEGTDTDADSFAAAQAATAAAPATSGALQYTTISFTSGAQMDGLVANELFRLKVTRDADNASDTMTGDAQLLAVVVKES